MRFLVRSVGGQTFIRVYSHPVLADLFLENTVPINVPILGHAALAITAIAENATFKEDSFCLHELKTAANSLEAPRASFPQLTPNTSKQSLSVSERKTDRIRANVRERRKRRVKQRGGKGQKSVGGNKKGEGRRQSTRTTASDPALQTSLSVFVTCSCVATLAYLISSIYA